MKMFVFKGLGTKDPKKFLFVVDVVWKAQYVTDDDMKNAQLVTMLQDKALSWYINFFSGKPNATMLETQKALNNEFKKSKSQAQSLTEFKEIRQRVNESTWDFDQRLKCLIPEAN